MKNTRVWQAHNKCTRIHNIKHFYIDLFSDDTAQRRRYPIQLAVVVPMICHAVDHPMHWNHVNHLHYDRMPLQLMMVKMALHSAPGHVIWKINTAIVHQKRIREIRPHWVHHQLVHQAHRHPHQGDSVLACHYVRQMKSTALTMIQKTCKAPLPLR